MELAETIGWDLSSDQGLCFDLPLSYAQRKPISAYV